MLQEVLGSTLFNSQVFYLLPLHVGSVHLNLNMKLNGTVADPDLNLYVTRNMKRPHVFTENFLLTLEIMNTLKNTRTYCLFF